MIKPTKGKIEIFCKNCGIKFSLYPSEIKYNRGKYHSRECFLTAHKNNGWNKGLTKENNESMKKQSESLKIYWKEHIQDHPRSMLGKHHSEETKLKMSLARRGNKNSHWKGGLTKLIRGIRRSPEYYQWRKEVLKRDNFTCQECGKTGESLHAHHKKEVFNYPELIFEVSNGITLCEPCHIKKRKKYEQNKN
jgi:ribosomal protein S27AE